MIFLRESSENTSLLSLSFFQENYISMEEEIVLPQFSYYLRWKV